MAPAAASCYGWLQTKEGRDVARNGRRLIEDYLPIREISAEASREKSVRKGHISTLHLWWARRPLVACRAAIYAALVPADAFNAKVTIHGPPEDPQETAATKEDLARSFRRGLAGEFIKDLCKYPGDPRKIEEARQHILATHAAKLSAERGQAVSVEAILKGEAPRPRVLDMFAGGGSIPLEALRLGCEAYALDINPVAHVIELCTLVYPQKYGQPDKNTKGSAKDGTWAGLAEEVRFWGKWVLERVKAEIGDLYPGIPDPDAPAEPLDGKRFLPGLDPGDRLTVPGRHLTPIAYLWTRTVPCKNPACGAAVPLVRQTWLCKKKDRFVALKVVAPKGERRVRFALVESTSEQGLGFDPAGFSKKGNATCPFCGTVANNDYVKAEGKAGHIGRQPMAVVCTRPGKKGKVYLTADDLPAELLPDAEAIRRRIAELCRRTGLTVPEEPINPVRPSPNARGLSAVTRHGLKTFGDLFTPRQMLCLLTFAAAVREAQQQMQPQGYDPDRAKAVASYLGSLLDKISTRSNTFFPWDNKKLLTVQCFGRQALPMLWDFAESNPLADASGAFNEALEGVTKSVTRCTDVASSGFVSRGSATALPYSDGLFDAVITDPPYYDNVPYADISDFFYVWLKRTIGHLYAEHFATVGTPKKEEAVADASRHGGSKEKARRFYEGQIAQALCEAHRVLKPCGQLVVVYAHKTTLGWSTLVDALRRAGFTITEAWPLDTEGYRLRALNSAALASSIFLVGRKREVVADVGNYEETVRPDLEKIVRERVDTLWKIGITGADLIIAAVGAGLRAFTQHSRVEFSNGEEVPATKFLREVEGVVHEALLEKIFSAPRTGVAAVDSASRFYVLWCYTYGAAELDAGEAIVFTYGLEVELDNGLSSGSRALIQKKKGKYRLRDFTERGADKKLGMPDDEGQPAPLVDVLHRILWLTENDPRALPNFLKDANPDGEHLRLVANVLAGPGLKGAPEGQSAPLATTTPAEQSALGKLLANWRNLMSSDAPLFDSP